MDFERVVAVGAAGLVLALSGTALAAPGDAVLEGATTEGVTVKVIVATAGNATAFRIGRTEVTCGHGTLAFQAGTYKPLDTSDPGAFDDRTRTASDNAGYHFETKSTIHGELQPGDGSWAGTFKLVTKVFERGDQIDDCKLKTSWTAA